MALVEFISMHSGLHRTPSDTVVDIDVHFVGGGWHLERWEVADLGLLVTFRRLGQVLRRKVVLLQSKRLYPREVEFVETHGLARPGGFGHLVRIVDDIDIRAPRTFRFDNECRYRALQLGDDQWRTIADYESQFGIPIHYLLYHPAHLPVQVDVPIQLPLAERPHTEVGARILPAPLLRASTTQFARNYAPSYNDLLAGGATLGEALPSFVADEVLGCREGYVPGDPFIDDPGVNRVFNLRGAPIAAAIAIYIDLPESVES